jgi:hypothetical protein
LGHKSNEYTVRLNRAELRISSQSRPPQIARKIEFVIGDAKTILTAGPIPHVCLDGLLAGYRRRPAAYLAERVRAAVSSYWKFAVISKGLEKLEAGLNSGE